MTIKLNAELVLANLRRLTDPEGSDPRIVDDRLKIRKAFDTEIDTRMFNASHLDVALRAVLREALNLAEQDTTPSEFGLLDVLKER